MNKTSSYEKIVIEILKKEKIPFIREKTFSDLHRGQYRFDFYIPSMNILIEVQGEQHYKYVPKYYKKRGDFLQAQERDRRKCSYALARDLKLYCIPYWKVHKIKTFTDILNENFLVNSKFHNDLVYQKYLKS